MSNFLKSDKGIILLLLILFFCFLPFFFLKQGLLLIDTGRELYLSQQVAQGGILYKDILNIYGPFAYQLNAILFNIFGEKLVIPYIAGIINSIIIVITLYLISREFLNKKTSFLLSILTMFSLVFTTFLFNSNITYSYGIVYALSSVLLSILFLTKYIKNSEVKFVYLSCFFAGLSVANKYEFILYPIVLFFVFSLTKTLKIKQKLIALLSFFLMPVVCFSTLFLAGLTISDLKNAIETMIKLGTSENIKFFYSNFGNFFDSIMLKKIIYRNPLIGVLGFLPIINIVLFCSQIKKFIKDKAIFIFCIASFLCTIKFLLFLNIAHMGAFLFPLCMLTTLVLIKNFETKIQYKYLILICLIFIFAAKDFSSLKDKSFQLITHKGNINTYFKDGKIIKETYNYLIRNTKETDKVVILPEGAIINFLSDRKTDNLYHNLVPLYYIDTFGEEKVLNNFKENPADYYIILPISTTEYGSKNFCDYAENFCNMINEEYYVVDEFFISNKGNYIPIYKRKNK